MFKKWQKGQFSPKTPGGKKTLTPRVVTKPPQF